MLFKILKYDLAFSAKMFFAMALILLAVAAILRFTLPMFFEAEDIFRLFDIVNISTVMMVLAAGIASIVQIFQFFNRNFFGDTGYLMLTLPVGRLKLLISKVIISIVWFNFMLITVAFSLETAWSTTTFRMYNFIFFFSRVSAGSVTTLIELNNLAITGITLMFLCITLAHSVFANRRVHIIVAGAIGFLYAWLFVWLMGLRGTWGLEMYTSEFVHEGEVFINQWQVPIIGLRYGRLPLAEPTDYRMFVPFIDIFAIGISIGFAAIAIGLTHYLLKHKAALQ